MEFWLIGSSTSALRRHHKRRMKRGIYSKEIRSQYEPAKKGKHDILQRNKESRLGYSSNREIFPPRDQAEKLLRAAG